jgi:hypothetical protein
VLGVLGFSVTGFADVMAWHPVALVVLPMTPISSAAALILGLFLVDRAGGSVRRRHAAGRGAA